MTRREPPTARTACGRPIDVDAAFSAENLDDTEQTALHIMRCFFVSLAQPESQGWRSAFTYGTACFGRDRGARIAHALMDMVEAMSHSRRSVFSFSNPRCACCARWLTEPEERLMRLLRATRWGDGPEVQTQALILCEGNPTARLVCCAVVAARELDSIAAPMSPARGPRPRNAERFAL